MPDEKKTKVIAVMPAYNAAATLERTIADIPEGSVDEIILVDDCSSDNTVELARSLNLTVIPHETNTGYLSGRRRCVPPDADFCAATLQCAGAAPAFASGRLLRTGNGAWRDQGTLVFFRDPLHERAVGGRG